jgi:hypothetical protein
MSDHKATIVWSRCGTRALGLTVPLPMLGRAAEVIE